MVLLSVVIPCCHRAVAAVRGSRLRCPLKATGIGRRSRVRSAEADHIQRSTSKLLLENLIQQSPDESSDNVLPQITASQTVRRRPKYSRIMLKVSGEALQGQQGFGIDPDFIKVLAHEIKNAVEYGDIQVAVVVGGGNYFRGADAWPGLERVTADYVGMLATVMNALCLQSALESIGVPTRVQTAIEMREVAEPFIRRRAIRHLERNRVVIFGAGTGNPFFTTDTAAALRAAEINAQVFLKATKVDGIYDCDPMKNSEAKRYDKITYRQVALDNLQVMDETAITLCKENNIPVIVFNITGQGNILHAALGDPVGTVVCCERTIAS